LSVNTAGMNKLKILKLIFIISIKYLLFEIYNKQCSVQEYVQVDNSCFIVNREKIQDGNNEKHFEHLFYSGKHNG
jgi:hypothetical protein